MNQLKQSLPLGTGEFTVFREIDDEPAFKWWVAYTLHRRDKIIAGVNKRTNRVTRKCGFELLTLVTHAKKLDKINGNTMWTDAINREMENLKVSFGILDDGANIPVFHNKASSRLIFCTRMSLEQKYRWSKDGHRTPEPEWFTFTGVASRESARVEFSHAALNDTHACACNIQNAYLQSPSSEKHYVVCSPEFGLEDVVKKCNHSSCSSWQ